MTAEEILSKAYGSDISSLTEEQRKQYEKDKKFLSKHLIQVQEGMEEYGDPSKFDFPEKDYFTYLLKLTKKEVDPETIISQWVGETSRLLAENSFVKNHLDEFITLAEENDREENENGSLPRLTRKCSRQDVLILTEGYLRKIDPSMQLSKEFIKLYQSGRICFESGNKAKSYYDEKDDVIHYDFDGTIETANTLVHEYMHRVHFTHGNPNNDRLEHSMFQEYPSIYYENGMIDYMTETGFISQDEAKSLKCSRLKTQHDKTPGKEYLMLLKLCKKQLETGSEITEDDIREEIGDTEQDFDELAQGLVKYCRDNFFTHEHVGLIMYKTSTALANATPHTPSIEQSLYKIAARSIVDKKSDGKFYEELEESLLKNVNQEEKINELPKEEIANTEELRRDTLISTTGIGKKTLKAQEDTKSKKDMSNILQNWKNKFLEIMQGRV